jgi:hypothetical protein
MDVSLFVLMLFLRVGWAVDGVQKVGMKSVLYRRRLVAKASFVSRDI